MCGRYEMFFTSENRDMNYIIDIIRRRYPDEADGIKLGEIFPTCKAPVIAAMHEETAPELFSWGFPKYSGSGVIINARSETVLEKPSFKNAMLEHRCVIPSTGFYEWSHDGTGKKYRFNIAGEENLYMAGIWKEYNGERKYVILTTNANVSMEPIHNRMPLIIRKKDIKKWINDTEAAVAMLKNVPPELDAEEIHSPFEQLTL